MLSPGSWGSPAPRFQRAPEAGPPSSGLLVLAVMVIWWAIGSPAAGRAAPHGEWSERSRPSDSRVIGASTPSRTQLRGSPTRDSVTARGGAGPGRPAGSRRAGGAAGRAHAD